MSLLLLLLLLLLLFVTQRSEDNNWWNLANIQSGDGFFLIYLSLLVIKTSLWLKPFIEILWQIVALCALFFFFFIPSTSKLSCGVVEVKSPTACWVPTHGLSAWKGWLDCEEVSGLFIPQLKLRLVYCRGDPHCVAQTLPRRLFTITMLTLALSLAVRRAHIYVFSL